jgi:hypothetical protein
MLCVFGCAEPRWIDEGTFSVPHDQEAVDIVASYYVVLGLSDPRPVNIVWYPDECLPPLWEVADDRPIEVVDDVEVPRCYNGLSAYFDVWCVAAIRYRSTGLSYTALAHELMHCSELDVWHKNRPLWDVYVPQANNVLRAAGL